MQSIDDINTSLIKNITWVTASRFITQVLAVLTNMILARALGVTGFGEYASISAVVLIANAITTFGTDMVLIRKISAEKDYSDLAASLLIQIILSSVFIAAIFFLHIFFSFSTALLTYVFSLIPLSLFTIATIALRGSHRINLFSILHFLFSLIQLFSAYILFVIKGDIFQLALLLLLAHALSSCFGIILCVTNIPGFTSHFNFSLKNILPLMRTSFPLAVIGSLRLIYEKITLVLLPIFSNLNTTGLYSTSTRVLDATKLGYISVFTPIYPEMARDKKFTKHQTGLFLLILSAICVSLLIFLFAKPIIIFLFGSEFSASVLSLQVIIWALPFYVIVSYYSLSFLAIELEKPVLVSLVAGLLVLLTMLIVLTQLYGLVGGALAVLSAEILQASLLSIKWRKNALSKLPK